MTESTTIPSGDLPKISIVLVTYNAAETLQACLDSIYKQQYPNLEIVVIDGASKDGTVGILNENSSRIAFYKSEKDNGIYDAMNKALNHITGAWVYFLGADDVLFDDFSALAFQLKDNGVIYYGNVIMNGKETGPLKSPYQLAKRNLCHQAIFYPASVFKKYNYETKYVINADHLLNMMCWHDKDYSLKYIDATIARFNDTGISSVKRDLLFEKDRPALIFKYFGLSAWARYIFRVAKVRLSAKK